MSLLRSNSWAAALVLIASYCVVAAVFDQQTTSKEESVFKQMSLQTMCQSIKLVPPKPSKTCDKYPMFPPDIILNSDMFGQEQTVQKPVRVAFVHHEFCSDARQFSIGGFHSHGGTPKSSILD